MNLLIEPVYGVDKTTAVNTYNVVSVLNNVKSIIFTGTFVECFNCRENYKNITHESERLDRKM